MSRYLLLGAQGSFRIKGSKLLIFPFLVLPSLLWSYSWASSQGACSLPQSLSGWPLPKFNKPNSWGFFPSHKRPAPGTSSTPWKASHPSDLALHPTRIKLADGARGVQMLGDAKQHVFAPLRCQCPVLHHPKNPAQGFYCCIFDKAGGNYRATANSRLSWQLPYSWPPSSRSAGVEGGERMPHL